MNNLLTKIFIKQRNDFQKSSAIRDKKLIFPKDVEEIQNIFYSDDGHEAHRMDIFRPRGSEHEILPVIINVHGGGMILGSKEFNRFYCAQLSSMGFLVFSVEFRLVPEFQVYDQFADLSAAMNTIQKYIPQYNGDPNHVYAVADSGGAYIVVHTIAMQKCPALAHAANVTPSDLKIQALGLISGMFYTTKFDKIGLFLPKYLYGKNYTKSAFSPYINPEHPDIVTSLPPCYLVTSHNDMLQHYTLNFEKALTRHKITHKLTNHPPDKAKTHAFSVFEPFREDSIEEMKTMLRFLRKY